MIGFSTEIYIRRLMWLGITALAYCIVVAVPITFAGESTSAWQQTGWPLVQKFCIDCHNEEVQEGEIDLTLMRDETSAPANAILWNRALQMIQFGAMPPEDAELPTTGERRALGDAVDRSLYDVTCDLRPKPGRVTARRLNRAEYQNTIRDLFAIDFNVSDEFPSDEVGGGFDNNADVLSMPPMLLEKYIEAAEQIAARAIFDPSSLEATEQERSGDGIGVVGNSETESFYGRILEADAFAWVEFDVEQAGKYRVKLDGSAWNKSKRDQPFAIYDELGTPIYADDFKSVERSSGSHSISFSRELAAGKRFFIIASLEELPDNIDEDHPDEVSQFAKLDRLDESAIAAGRKQFGTPLEVNHHDVNDQHSLMVRRFSIDGPSEYASADLPSSQAMILRRVAYQKKGRYEDVDDAARECLKPLIEKMFRRPADDETVNRYVKLVEDATEREESFHRGMQIALTALLVSPRFLFRVEVPESWSEPDAYGDHALSSLQLASRLSYFLWSSTPDDTLMQLAKNGKLDEEKELKRQVQRMLRDPRSRSMSSEFAAQWFGLRNLAGVDRDAERFPQYDAELLDSMTDETAELFRYVMRENLPVGELLSADYTFIDKSLAKFYDLPWKDDNDDPVHRVSLTQTERRGVLTHASVLTLTSYPTRTSPVQRGKWILENVLGTPPPDPPPNVPELGATKGDLNATIREQLAMHRDNAACASCHRVMDQLGFGFEQFDAIGQFRQGEQLDASGELPGGRKFAGGRELAEILRQTESERFALTVTERLLAFALGRELTPDDRCVTDKITNDNAAKDYPLADIVTSVVLSRPFRYFHAETPSPSSEASP